MLPAVEADVQARSGGLGAGDGVERGRRVVVDGWGWGLVMSTDCDATKL